MTAKRKTDAVDARARAAVMRVLREVGVDGGDNVEGGLADRILKAAGRVYNRDEKRRVDELLAEVGLAGIDFDDGMRIQIANSYKLCAEMALAFRTVLDVNPGAINYIEQLVKPAGMVDGYVFIVVKPGGKTPHQLRREAEQRAEAAEALLDGIGSALKGEPDKGAVRNWSDLIELVSSSSALRQAADRIERIDLMLAGESEPFGK